MDAKITKTRLSRMLSYDWLKIVGLALAAILVWTLILTMTATRITPAQQFKIYNYAGVTMEDKASSLLFNAQHTKDGVFSYEVIETGQEDLNTAGDQMHTILEARFTVDEGDLLFLADIDDTNYPEKDDNGEITGYQYSYVESFVLRYARYAYDMDKYLADMESYLKVYFGEEWKTGNLNTDKAETDFRTRVKKDKRYKKESQIVAELPNEFKRLENYRDGLLTFQGYLADGTVSLTQTEISLGEGEEKVTYKGNYSVNISPKGSDKTEEKLKEYFSYIKRTEKEDGTVETEKCADDMNVVFLKMPNTEKGFEYESLLFVNYLIENSLTEQAQ